MMLRRFPASPWEGLDIPSALLLGIQRDPGPPVQFGQHRFERLRIVIIDRDPVHDDSDGDAEIEAEENDGPEILPRIATMRRGNFPPARPVHGEILRGEDGALYERFGNRIRPLRGLASGPRGEVLEIETTGDRSRLTDGNSPREAVPSPVSPGTPGSPDSPRALFAAPGHWRVVRFGDFRNTLTPQLAHPSRLRETHWLPCHVQVFETAASQKREPLAAIALGDEARASELIPVTPPLVQALQLSAVLPPPVRGTVRFAHVLLAHDPTEQETGDRGQEPGDRRQETPADPPAPVAQVPTAPPAPKTEIPAQHLQTAPFVLSREAAYVDLAADDQARASRVRRWFGADAHASGQALREWQLQLSGRPVDDQLWAVPPPTGWRRDESVLSWAAQTLDRGGYSPAMLPEWRLYWRRRGC